MIITIALGVIALGVFGLFILACYASVEMDRRSRRVSTLDQYSGE